MGCNCVTKEVTSKASSMMSSQLGTEYPPPSTITSLKAIKFYETTLKVNKVKAEHLVLFMDHSINICQNDNFTKLPN